MTPDRLLTGLNCPHLCGIPASLKLRLCVCGAASRLARRLPPSNQLTRSLVARLLLAIQPLLPSSLGQKRPGKTTQMAFSLIRKPFPSQIPAQEMAIIAMGNVTYFYLTQLSTMVWFLRVSSQLARMCSAAVSAYKTKSCRDSSFRLGKLKQKT